MSLHTPVAPIVRHIKQPNFPELRFEWHVHIGKVYVTRVGTDRGICIAEHVDTEALAFGFVQTYLRGYKAGQQFPKELLLSQFVADKG